MEKIKRKSTLREYLEAFAIAGVLAFTVRTFLFQAFKIPSGSMIPTLLVGDHIIVEKFLYNTDIPFISRKIREIKHGDVIVFEFPRDPNKDFIKRAIGMPGDTVELKKGVLYINNVEIKEDFKENVPYNEDYSGKIFIETIDSIEHLTLHQEPRSMISIDYGPIKIPDDSYFVMGDNRDNSSDSRIWGFVNKSAIKGKAFIIYWSWGNNGGLRVKRIGRIIK
jgi:signal peptidase I